MSIPFYKTVYGRRFFDSQLPDLIKVINRLTEEVKKSNEKSEKEPNVNIIKSNSKKTKPS